MLRIRAFSPKNQAVTRKSASLSGRKSERGGVIIIILIAIALFAALSFTFSKGNRSSASSIDEQKANLYATEILNHFRAVKNVTDELQISNGCEPLALSVWADWSGNGALQSSSVDRFNPERPNHEECSIHLPEGGNLPILEHPSFLEDSEIWRNYIMIGRHAIEGLGGPGGEINYELVLYDTEKAKSICNAFNRLIGLEENLSDHLNISFMPYVLSYTDDTTGQPNSIIGDSAPELAGQRVGCFVTNFTGAHYVFYQVLGAT